MLEATIRDNKLYLEISGISSMRFETKAYVASDGQPIEKNVDCKIGEDGTSWVLTFKAGRHGSKVVAEKFIEYVTNEQKTSGACIACQTGETHPDKLNFAFLGDLYVKKPDGDEYVGKDIVIAQGHNARDENNWWIGGRNMNNLFDAKVIKGVEQTFKQPSDALIGFYLLTFMPYLSEPNRFSITMVGLEI